MVSKIFILFSELMIIRDILMGEIINEYNECFEKFEVDL